MRRGAQRADYAPETVRGILAEGSICHVAFSDGGQAHVIPTAYGLLGDEICIHGSTANRVLRGLAKGADACLEVTLVDGLVLARSAFHHSMNYRSAILYGRARVVDDPAEKLDAMRALIDHLIPGRWDDVRAPNPEEFARTLVLALPVDEASAKVRTGPPVEEEEDYATPCWAGVLPLETVAGAPVADDRLVHGVELPGYVSDRTRVAGGSE
ncbi:MAG: pyridoxamine 5'-phosphate oxidase family protein [Deltaproteobacteria bacterium]|nr:pyridoxamine 5'-phosphate oxidase family protein [Deltaproteobacteria bacterium]MBW2415134.1 pyridoxamine 5'-phosphate oxidase family protein [Deltaproteobacteria bacterium]